MANAGFEEKNVCVEYHALCAPEAWFRIPWSDVYVKSTGDIQSHSGLYYQNLVVENINKPVTYRSFIYTKILCPLLKDSLYSMSLWVNCLNNNFEHFDVWMPEMEPTLSKKTLKEITAEVIFSDSDIIKKEAGNWLLVKKQFRASGSERYLMLGNMSGEALQRSAQSNRDGDVIYQVDDIALKPIRPFAPCDEFEATRQQLYDMNYRHTVRKYIDDIPLRKMLIRKQPMPVDTLPQATTASGFIDTAVKTRQNPIVNDTLVLPDVLFRYNSSTINPSFASLLDSAMVKIRSTAYKQIMIVGHTDNAGSDAYNLQLSLNRAESVKQYLTRKKEFSADVIVTAGKGESAPVEDNATASGREKNRRVEIVIIR